MAKFGKQDLERAIADLGMCKFFPTDPAVHVAVMALLAKMCPSKEALTWLIDTMVNRVGEWKGPAELRGVLCWRFAPADGLEQISTSPGFRPEDGEAQSLEEHAQLKAGGTLPMLEESRQLVRQIAGKGWPA